MKTQSDEMTAHCADLRGPVLLDRLGRITLLATIILVPVAFWLRFSDNFEVPKQAIFGSLVLFLWLITLASPRRRRLIWTGPVAPALGAIALCAIVSWAANGAFPVGWSGEEGSWKGASSVAGFALAAVILGPWLSSHMLRKLAAGVFASAILLSVYAFAQLAGWEPVYWNPQFKASHWIFGMLGNPVHLANYLACAFLLSLCVFPVGSRLAWLLRAPFLLIVMVTWQESALAALGLGVFVYALACRRFRLAAFLIAATVGLFLAAGSGKGALGSRPHIWLAAGRLLRVSPILGIGPGLFYSRFPAVVDYGYFAAEPPVISGATVSLRLPASAHNEPIDWAARMGLVGLGAYIWILTAAVRARREPDFLPPAAGLWVVHLANPPSVATGSLFWIFLAALARPRRAAKTDANLGRGIANAAGAAVVLISAFIGLRLGVVQAYRYQINRVVLSGERPAALEILSRWSEYAGALHPGQAQQDALLLDSLRKDQPGAIGENSGQRAIELAQRACAANPYSIFYPSTLASFELARGRERGDAAALARSESLLRRLRDYAPAVLSLNDDLAEVLEAQGRKSEAGKLRREREMLDVRRVFRVESASP